MMAAHQFTCVAIGDRAVLIDGPSGAGKSSLALELIDRGALLVGDDSVELDVRDGSLIASPHPETRGLLEVRNLGLVRMDVLENVLVCLHVRLDGDAPRYIEEARTVRIEGIDLPSVTIHPAGSTTALKAELALREFGLQS